ncbi:MAG: M13 family metallopeptidase [Gemmatimonadales bacterium]
MPTLQSLSRHATRAFVLVVFGAIRLAAQAAQPVQTPNSQPRDLISSFAVGGWGVNLADRDPTVKPGDDFFMSENGTWFKNTELGAQIPMSAYWRDLRRLVPRQLAGLLENAAANHAAIAGSDEARVGSFYRAFMDEGAVEAKGLSPLRSKLDAIRAVRKPSQLSALMGAQANSGYGVFGVFISQDSHNPERYAAYLNAGGLSLPGPEYYLDPQFADIRKAYESYVGGMLRLIEWPMPEQRARDILALETEIAKVSWSHEQMRDALLTDNPMSVTELKAFAPGIDWDEYFRSAGLGQVRSINLGAKSAFPKIAQIFASTPVAVWQARQAFGLADNDAPFLNAAAVALNFDFRAKQFNSSNVVALPRSQRAAITTDQNIGDMLGTLYLGKYFSPAAKAMATEMFENIRTAFGNRIRTTPWMSDETKVRSLDKLAKMTAVIGYPEKRRDYTGLRIEDGDLYGNVDRARRYRWQKRIAQLDKPFDRVEGAFTPQTVNYNSNFQSNSIEIPAGLLQPPFFDVTADPAVNYGAVGVTIGQVMASAFDDIGQHYEADGRLHDTWTPAEQEFFQTKKKALAEQYSSIEPIPGIHIKGDLVVNEAIDDLGGTLAALDAYHLSLKGAKAPVIDGFTGDQRFFMGHAQMWRAKFPPSFVRNQIAQGSNSPPFVRVNYVTRNVDGWYDAFNVQPGERLYVAPENRIRIW